MYERFQLKKYTQSSLYYIIHYYIVVLRAAIKIHLRRNEK